MKKFLFALFAFILIGGSVFLGTSYYYNTHAKTVEVTKEVEKIVEKEVTISGETIKYNISNIGKLSTAEYSYTHVEQVDETRKINGFKIPLTKSSFIYSYDGKITAGIDFTEVQVDKNDTTKEITVTLPDVEIISSDVDEDSFELYDEKNNIFNPISVTDVIDSLADLKTSEEEKAISRGLLDDAKSNAINLVENFLQASCNVQDYKINIIFNSDLEETSQQAVNN
jgi:hypothetical protein